MMLLASCLSWFYLYCHCLLVYNSNTTLQVRREVSADEDPVQLQRAAMAAEIQDERQAMWDVSRGLERLLDASGYRRGRETAPGERIIAWKIFEILTIEPDKLDWHLDEPVLPMLRLWGMPYSQCKVFVELSGEYPHASVNLEKCASTYNLG
jgi:hypothetical protein